MDLPEDMDDYIKQSIEFSVGLPVSTQTLECKLRASEDARQQLRDQYLHSQMKLREKDKTIERARSESSMNAQALKKFVEENKKLAAECATLLKQCQRWEKECALYDHDREALMEFGNEADARAREAEIRVHELEEAFERATEELKVYKNQCETNLADSSAESSSSEQLLLESLMTTLVKNDEAAPMALAFLEANGGVDVCQKLLKVWNSLRPSTQKVLALAAEVKALQKDKEHLRINLTRAEEEVHLLFEENKILNKENKTLMRNNERCLVGSAEKHGSGTISGKGSKRKSSPKPCSPIGMDLGDADCPRMPLSSLQQNSPESRMHKK